MSETVVEHVVSTNSQSLSAVATIFNRIVMATTVPRRSSDSYGSPSSFELGDIVAQSEVTLGNLKSDLEKAGSSMADVLHLTIYLTDMTDWAGFNDVYQRHFPKPYPVRAAICVKALAIEGMRVEVTAIAARNV